MELPTVPKVQLGAQQFCSFGDLNMMNQTKQHTFFNTKIGAACATSPSVNRTM
jgi:hypothetical protein